MTPNYFSLLQVGPDGAEKLAWEAAFCCDTATDIRNPDVLQLLNIADHIRDGAELLRPSLAAVGVHIHHQAPDVDSLG
jgi:hypothetical protein